MKIFVLLLSLFFSSFASAESFMETKKIECLNLIKIAETKEMDSVYEYCGFSNPKTAWKSWALLLTENKLPKAMYQLAIRNPKNDYASIYIKRSAEYGYIPAVYELALQAKKENDLEQYENYLKEIIQLGNLDGKLYLDSAVDLKVRDVYEELAHFYLEKNDSSLINDVIALLKISADLDSPTAAHTLASLLYLNSKIQSPKIQEKYMWKAIEMGCDAAEANWGLMLQLKENNVLPGEVRKLIDERKYSCKLPEKDSSKKVILSAKDCDCQDVLTWYNSQKDKPYLIQSIENNTAVLKDLNKNTYSVKVADKISDGYVVEDIRPTAVIIRRLGKRFILLKQDNLECLNLCLNPTQKIRAAARDLPFYHLQFTPYECQRLAEGIEYLNNPSQELKGAMECQLQDWKRWGEGALKTKRNKHLFLLQNYKKADYAPAQLALAEMLLQETDERYMILIGNLLTYATQNKPEDALSYLARKKAFCIKTKLHMDGKYADSDLAFAWASAGAQEGYPESINMLGVLYANGMGVEQDLNKAKELFLLADKNSSVPFVDALNNYKTLKSKKTDFVYGNCQGINPEDLSIKEVIKLYLH